MKDADLDRAFGRVRLRSDREAGERERRGQQPIVSEQFCVAWISPYQ